MRLPSRMLVVAGFVSISGTLGAQAPPPPTPAPPAVSGKKALVAPHPQAVSQAEAPAPLLTTETAPLPLGYESDLYCFGYLGRLAEPFSFQVTGAEAIAEQTDFVTDDLLFVDGGVERGLRVGDQYWIVTPEQEVFHPANGRTMGRFYQYRGRATVHSVEGRAGVVRVTSSCTDIPMGSFLKPFEPIPIPLARKTLPAVVGDPPSGKPSGRIVFSRDGVVALGSDNMVIVDLGAASGVSPGDFMTVFRYAWSEEFGIRPMGSYWVNVPPPPGVAIPRTYLGEGAVLAVGDRWSIVRLTDSFRLVGVGDEVELK